MEQQVNSLKDLELLKQHEEKIKKYREEKSLRTETPNYKQLAYKIKNPFRGV